MAKLKPCPFCGDKKEVHAARYVNNKWKVNCLMCEATGPTTDMEEEAIVAWNKRANRA